MASTTAVVDAESRGEYVIVARQISTSSERHPNSDYGFLAHLLSPLVKGREDVITGKPEASNTFFIK